MTKEPLIIPSGEYYLIHSDKKVALHTGKAINEIKVYIADEKVLFSGTKESVLSYIESDTISVSDKLMKIFEEDK